MLVEEVANWIGFMKDIEESANNAVEVLNELMSYDKIEMKTMQIEKEPVAIWDLLATSIKPFYIQAKERGLQLKVQLEDRSSHGESLDQVSSCTALLDNLTEVFLIDRDRIPIRPIE